MNKWCFNKKYFNEKIMEGNLVLQKYDKGTLIYDDAKDMVLVFDKILKKKNIPELYITKDDFYNYCERLTHFFNKALEKISLEQWEELKDVCCDVPKSRFKNISSNVLPKNNTYVVNEVLKLYRKIDKEAYDAAYQIVNNDVSLINISKTDDINNCWCFLCGYLKLPFVNISANKDYKYVALAHELRHATDYYLHNINGTNIDEVSSIYTEILMVDEVSKYTDCYNLACPRINHTTLCMLNLISCIDALMRFEKLGCRVTLNNISLILDIDNDKELTAKYLLLKNKGILGLYNYVVSTLMAVYFRDEYYNGNKKIVNENIKQLLLGKEYSLNFDIWKDKYVDYVKEVKTFVKK